MDSSASTEVKGNELLQVHAHVWKYAFSYISSMCLKCAVQLSIPEIIHNHGKPMTLSSLVDALSLPPSKTEAVNRLMRFLIHAGFFATQKLDENQEDLEEVAEEGFLLTPSSRYLIKDDTNTLSSIVLAIVDPVLVTPFYSLSDWFRGNGSTTFEAGQGMGIWNFLEHHPEYSKNFNYAMANDSRPIMSVVVNEGKAVFENLKSLVDVGGGNGTSAKAIAEAFPHLKCLVLDLPHVVADHIPKINTKNLDFIGGNMFDSIPRADAVLMKNILHDWSDKDCVKILKRCREAIPGREEGGKMIILDVVMEDRKQEHDSTEIQLLFDMIMMTIGGKERTEKEWKKLFLESGFTDYKITPLLGFRSIIEVYP
ncbi:O-methyltransferase [Macleaya cordata]|uniref:O-methyltransferase n=1 Tax=Macleaya cordata TaxID=56857 RepID=A0A200PP85_MACCD|nr:O-methyltransferase [Macleaya cordata]